MELIRREDVLRLIVAAGRNHATAIREEEEKAAASGVKMASYAYAINVLAMLGAIVHDIPKVAFSDPVDPEVCQAHQSPFDRAMQAEEELQRARLEEDDSPTEGDEEVHLHE